MIDVPLVSIVIPTYGRPARVIKAIESVLAQTYSAIEVIVVDDASPEPVAPMLQNLFGDRIICLRHDRNLGGAAARNSGIRLAKGDWIAFLDDDDRWRPEKLERQMGSLQAMGFNPAVSYCWSVVMGEEQELKVVRRFYRDGDIDKLVGGNIIGPTSVVLVHRTCLASVGLFDEELQSCQDWDMWLRCALVFPVVGVSEVLVEQHAHGEQISTNLEKKIDGRQKFLSKHAELLRRYPEVYRNYLQRLGALCLFSDRDTEAGKYLVMAVRACPWSWKAWKFIGLFFLRTIPFCRKKLVKGSTSHFGRVVYYH